MLVSWPISPKVSEVIFIYLFIFYFFLLFLAENDSDVVNVPTVFQSCCCVTAACLPGWN